MANLNVLPQVQTAKIDQANSPELKETVKSAAEQKEFEKELQEAAADATVLAMLTPQAVVQAPVQNVELQNVAVVETAKASLELPQQKFSGQKDQKIQKDQMGEKDAVTSPLSSPMILSPQIQSVPQQNKTAPVNAVKNAPQVPSQNVQGLTQKSEIPQLNAMASAVATQQNVPLVKGEGSKQGNQLEQLPLQAELNVSEFDVQNVSTPVKAVSANAIHGLNPVQDPNQPLKNGPKSKAPNEKDSISAVPTRPNAVSTDDFMSMRNSLKRPKGEALSRTEGQPLTSAHPHSLALNPMAPALAPMIDAHTTQGSQGKTILSHDAIDRMTQQVSMLNQLKQDGEIKIRLRPDHLGEIQMSVKAQGQQVSIQIKAASGEAKRIIEESLGSLKESLSHQNLSLSQVDVVTQPNASHSMSSDSFNSMDLSKQQHGAFEQQRNSREDRYQDESLEPRRNNVSQIPAARVKAATKTTQGLDLIA